MDTFSPPKTPEWAGALPGVVGEGEGLQAVKGEARGQLAQAVVIQVNMLQCAHAREGAIRELGGQEEHEVSTRPCPADPRSVPRVRAGVWARAVAAGVQRVPTWSLLI